MKVMPCCQTESVAAAFDVMHSLDVDQLAASYSRVGTAKALKKTPALCGNQGIEPTLVVIFAVDSMVPLDPRRGGA
jgi:hypothetical protein